MDAVEVADPEEIDVVPDPRLQLGVTPVHVEKRGTQAQRIVEVPALDADFLVQQALVAKPQTPTHEGMKFRVHEIKYRAGLGVDATGFDPA